jgi:hypothetical protein
MAPRVRKKKKDDDEVTRLQKQIRELKSMNRALLKRLKKVDRNYEEETKEELDQELEERYVELSDPTCKDCGRGNIIIIDLPSGKLKMCDVCKKRTKTKH